MQVGLIPLGQTSGNDGSGVMKQPGEMIVGRAEVSRIRMASYEVW